MSARPPAPDQAERDGAIAARGVNVIVDAGAGTGKTTLLVDRLVAMVAPPDGRDPIPLSEIAAITFTRKAAGELKLRVREKLLAELAAGPSGPRREQLARALSDADTAFIGTIHGFSDRLLRRHPVEARLSPSYEVVEDADALCAEAFELLLQGAEAGRLADDLAGTGCSAEHAREAQEVVRLAVAAELRTETREGEWHDKVGLDRLFQGFILHRDVPPADAKPARFERQKTIDALQEFIALAKGSRGPGRGSRWMAATAKQLERLLGETDPAVLFRELSDVNARTPKLGKKKDFPDDGDGWDAWKAWTNPKEGDPLREQAMSRLARWLATRLVRLFPAAVATYEQVKARHRAVDQVDLLLKLRDLLRDHPPVRAELQRLFRHVFVDEFQDTDPLQAEIVLFLCEDGARAKAWSDVALAPGRLTVVGDPKQSIYRFRRADIAVYEAVRAMILRGTGRAFSLTANFRSEPALIEHLNARHDELLGTVAPGAPPFDAVRGTVANVPLAAGRKRTRERAVVTLPLCTESGKAADERALEARVLAAWLRQLADGAATPIVDPSTGKARPATFGDVAVLAHSTTHVGLLIEQLDLLGVPWSARGGTLFLQDALHRHFLLALRAISDRDDGVAQAALFRAPFFALDLGDLARERAAAADARDPGVLRARAAKSLVEELRRERLSRSPGQTARDLLDRTGLARSVAFGPNGTQRLERLRELCLEVDRIAAADGLDYDGVTARLREWALDPVSLDPPRPVGGDAVQLMTIHQAKGLEFPIVAWWDGHAKLAPYDRQGAWFVGRDGVAWAIQLDGLSWEEPADDELLARELAYLAAERLRLVYVAATRARDLLVLPLSAGLKQAGITSALAGPPDAPAVERMEEFTEDATPKWAKRVAPQPKRTPKTVKARADELAREWDAATAEAGRARFVPKGVSTEAHRVADEEREGDAGEWWKTRKGRYGNVFGETVHEAIGVALREPKLDASGAVAKAVRATGLGEHVAEAAQDVERALGALSKEGLRVPPGDALRLEYPVAQGRDGLLLVGYIDLLAARGGGIQVIDFKTDAPPAGEVTKSHPDYVEQVRSYARILVELGLAREGTVRCGLLFTADGGLRWV
jgi:ATP-dependent helicase/nuclease subunit A